MKKLLAPKKNDRFLNFGGGNWYFPRWENIDYYAEQHFVDYQIDLSKGDNLLFLNQSVNAIFTSHLLEHLSDPIVSNLLKEFYRILKPFGILRISVPDMDKALNAYIMENFEFFENCGVSCVGNSPEEKLTSFFASYEKKDYRGGPKVNSSIVKRKIIELNKYDFAKWCVSLIPNDADQFGHINAYDSKKIITMLKEAGFKRIISSSYRNSIYKTFRLKFFDVRPKASIYIEAVKTYK